MKEEQLTIDYYSDVLCVWAWIAQRRLDELNKQFGERLNIRHHYVDVFGDVAGKMATQWKTRGGYEGFATHVREAASGFDTAPVADDIWQSVRPASSAMAHLLLKALAVVEGEAVAAELAVKVREAFFVKTLDIGDQEVLLQLFACRGIDTDRLRSLLSDGRALAALMADYQKAREWGIKGSPSFVMDDGRQTLYGNVGYRVLSANVEELLNKPTVEACWC